MRIKTRKNFKQISSLAVVLAGSWLSVSTAVAEVEVPPLSLFSHGNSLCYDTEKYGKNYVVDSHLHFQPFNGPALDYPKLMEYLNKAGILFVNAYGIGQKLPAQSSCMYYLDCPGEPVLPNMSSDFRNVEDFYAFPSYNPVVRLSMSFPDFHDDGQRIVAQKDDLLKRLGNKDKIFTWAGEINAAKQALCENHQKPINVKEVEHLKAFMAYLKEQDMPLAVHSDLGYDDGHKVEQTCELNENKDHFTYHKDIIEAFLENYKDQKIVWVHMGLSKEMKDFDHTQHIALLTKFFEAYPHFSVDISWRVVAENYFNTKQRREDYLNLMRKYPTRFLTGTDTIAAKGFTYAEYKDAKDVTGAIFNDLNLKQSKDREVFRRVVLGQNYFDISNMSGQYTAPQICR